MSKEKGNDMITVDNMVNSPHEKQRTLADVAKTMALSDPNNKAVKLRVIEEKQDGSSKKQWAGCTNTGKTWHFTK